MLTILAALMVAAPTTAQQRGLLSPEAHEDRRVTFRLSAPEAESVAVSGEFMDGERALSKSADGVWSVTLGPLDPEVYEYQFEIDGMTFLDPRNPVVKTNQGPSTVSSVLTVREGNRPLFFDVRPVPHGTVEIRTYDSSVTGLSRDVYVYTPPGYERMTEPLPVLYLLHGADGEDRSWTMLGRAHTIMDNLIAAGETEPFVIVMPYGYAYPWDWGASGTRQQEDFLADLKSDLIPFIEADYRVGADREHRALAGLSRGGSQTLNIGLRHLDLFSRLAVFSASGGSQPEVGFADVAENVAEVNRQLDLFWIGMGTEDGGHARAVLLHEFLDDVGVEHTFREIPGAHTWIVWRKFLDEVAPQLW
jgi:enterochelin esterase family protein